MNAHPARPSLSLVPTNSEVTVAPPRSRLEAIAAGFLSNYSGHTQVAYRRDLLAWAIFCADHDVEVLDAERAVVQLHARALEEAGRAAATIARRLAAISGFYTYAVQEGFLDRSPAAHVRRPHVDDESTTLGLDRSELNAFLAAAKSSPASVDYALTCLLAMNGLRVSEACGADVGDLSSVRTHQVLRITRKGGKKAHVPLAPRAAVAIEAHVGIRQLGPLLLDRRGQRLKPYQATRVVARLARSAGINKHLTPHSLRHSWVTLALDANVALRDVQAGAGHADPRTTMRYDRARESLDRHATYRLDKYLDESA